MNQTAMALRIPATGKTPESHDQDPELIEWAAELEIDPAGLSNEALLRRIKEVQRRWWEVHGKDVMRAYNEMIARDGRPLDGWPND